MSIDQYLTDIARYQLLQPSQEILLGKRVQAWLEIKDQTDLTPEQRRIKRLGLRAREMMINANLRLVVHIAKKYLFRSQSGNLLDIVGMGNEGLIKGVERFDPTRGYRLTTYLYWWIRQAIVRGLHDTDSMIRLPTHVHEQLAIVAKHVSTAGKPLSLEAAAIEKGVSTKILFAAQLAKGIASLDRVQENDHSILESIPDQTPLVDDYAAELDIDVMALVRNLESREQFVLLRRFGRTPWTLKACGKELGVSRERTRQIEDRAIRKLRFATGILLSERNDPC
jgi:RNA polymerase sigma factor (sigma-70 family)